MNKYKKGKPGQYVVKSDIKILYGKIDKIDGSYFSYKPATNTPCQSKETALDFRWWIEEGYEFVSTLPSWAKEPEWWNKIVDTN